MFSNKPNPIQYNTQFNYDAKNDILTIKDIPIKEGGDEIAAPETLGAIHAMMAYLSTMNDFELSRREILVRSYSLNHTPIPGKNYQAAEFELVGVHNIYPLLFKIQELGRDKKEEPYLSLWLNLQKQGVYNGFIEKHKELLGLEKKNTTNTENFSRKNFL